MFRGPEQRERVFAHLLAIGVLPAGSFCAAGPTEAALALGESGAEQIGAHARIVRIALALWAQSGALPLGEVLRLEAGAQEIVGGLLMAIGLGHAAIDRWLEESSVSGA